MKWLLMSALSCLALAEPAFGDVLDDVAKLARPSLTLNHEIGLDSATRALLEGYPPKVREEVIKALKEALPLIDESVMKYLEAVNSIVAQRLSQAACLTAGVLKNTVDDAGAALIFGKRGATPFKDLDDMRRQALQRLQRSSPPKDFVTAHSDILIKASATVCQSLAVGATAAASEAFVYAEEANRRLAIWSPLKNRCATASLCADDFRERLAAMIRDADGRDVRAVSAQSRFTAVGWPSQERLFETFDPLRYDQALGEAAAIEQSLRLTRLVRETKAQILISKASDGLDRVRKATGIGDSMLRPALFVATSNLGQMREAQTKIGRERDLMAKTLKDCEAISNMARAAGILDPSNLDSRSKRLVADTATISSEATARHQQTVKDLADLEQRIRDYPVEKPPRRMKEVF